jgi:xanthine dehydrogenase small subunit
MSLATATTPLRLIVNGRSVEVVGDRPPLTLLEFLRRHGWTGAKEGCAEGECGACAVALVAAHGARSTYRVVNSCLLPVTVAADREIVTIESLAADGRLAPAQQAMAAAGGSQCGYCTPGFVMSLFAEQYRPGRREPCDPHALSGNLCRCTGYRPIRDAALSLGAPPPGAFLDRLDRAAPRLTRISSAGFSRPLTLSEYFSDREAHPDAAVISGGSDLGVEMNLRGRRWSHLISLEAIDELQQFSESADAVTIGAALPLSDIAQQWTTAPAVIAVWLELFASPLIRNRATLGGNLATASPIGDGAPLLLALDASVRIARRDGMHLVPLSAFFLGYRKTALAPGELIVSIEIPKPFPSRVQFYKIAKRRIDDISTVAAAFAVDLDRGGVVSRARFAFGGVAATPVRVIEAERAVVGQAWTQGAVGRVQRILDTALTPIGDHRGTKEYRRAVSKSLVEKFWWEHT